MIFPHQVKIHCGLHTNPPPNTHTPNSNMWCIRHNLQHLKTKLLLCCNNGILYDMHNFSTSSSVTQNPGSEKTYLIQSGIISSCSKLSIKSFSFSKASALVFAVIWARKKALAPQQKHWLGISYDSAFNISEKVLPGAHLNMLLGWFPDAWIQWPVVNVGMGIKVVMVAG